MVYLSRPILPAPLFACPDRQTSAPFETRAASGTESRLVATASALEEEGWWREKWSAPARQLQVDATRKILRSREACDSPFKQSLNPYRGCELGCIYCCARPAHALLGLSPTLDFETRIFHKPHAARLLRRELGRPGYRYTSTVLGSATDAYQPAERELLLTRGLLEVLYELHHPVTVMTKSSLVLRDLELLAIMARSGLVQVLISLSTLDGDLAKKMEPQAATPQARLGAIRQISDAGIPVGVVLAPIIPGLTDQELENVLSAARQAGAHSARYSVLRLPCELLKSFDHWLLWNAPKHVARVMAVLYGRYGCKAERLPAANPIRGFKRYSHLLDERFKLASAAFGFAELPELNSRDFQASPKVAPDDEADHEQGRLF